MKRFVCIAGLLFLASFPSFAGSLYNGNGTQGNGVIVTGPPYPTVDASSVTLQGNIFNAAGKLLQADTSGYVATGHLNPSTATLQGNTFNAANKLVQLNGSTQLPAVSGTNLTNLNASNLASGTIPDARVDSSSVTLQGNTFNTASHLVQLNSGGVLSLGAGSVSVPSLNLSDSGTGLYRPGSNQLAVAVNGVKAIVFANVGSSDDTLYSPVAIGGPIGSGINVYTTTGVTTSAKQIGRGWDDVGVALVAGNDGSGDEFFDLLMVADANVTPTVVQSKTIAGSPASRSYTSASGQVKLTMGSGTYTVSFEDLGLNFR